MVNKLGGHGRATYDVLAERNRQITAEGYSTDHDDLHANGELAAGAGCFAMAAANLEFAGDEWRLDTPFKRAETARENMVKCAAMALAEIERLDRKADYEKEIASRA